jgi:hypothetical protein
MKPPARPVVLMVILAWLALSALILKLRYQECHRDHPWWYCVGQ